MDCVKCCSKVKSDEGLESSLDLTKEVTRDLEKYGQLAFIGERVGGHKLGRTSTDNSFKEFYH